MQNLIAVDAPSFINLRRELRQNLRKQQEQAIQSNEKAINFLKKNLKEITSNFRLKKAAFLIPSRDIYLTVAKQTGTEELNTINEHLANNDIVVLKPGTIVACSDQNVLPQEYEALSGFYKGFKGFLIKQE